MGLMDRIKETAQQGLDKGQAKVSEHQAKTATADLLRNLGLVAYRQRTSQGDPAHLDQLAATLVQQLESQVQTYGPLPEPEIPAAATAPAAAPGPTQGFEPPAAGGFEPPAGGGFEPTAGGGFAPQAQP